MDSKKYVVFVAFTSYHLISSMYYSYNVEWRDYQKILVWQQNLSEDVDVANLNGFFDVIINIPNKKRGGKISSLYYALLYSGRLFSFSRMFKILKLSKQCIVICFSDQNPVTKKIIKTVKSVNVNSKVVLVEEGMKTYADSVDEIKFNPIKKFLIGYEGTRFIGESSEIDSFVVRKPENLSETKKSNREIIKQSNIFESKGFIDNLYLDESFLRQFIDVKNNQSILWLSGPLEELGVLEDKEIELLRDIAMDNPNHTIYIKRHPREKKSKYDMAVELPNVKMIELGSYFWLPMELIVDKINPHVVITVISSAAYNLYNSSVKIKLIYCFRTFPDIRFDCSVFDSQASCPNVFFAENYSQVSDYIRKPLVHDNKNNSKELNTYEDIVFLNRVAKQ